MSRDRQNANVHPQAGSLEDRRSLAAARLAASRARVRAAKHAVLPGRRRQEVRPGEPRSLLFRTLSRHKGAVLGGLGAVFLARKRGLLPAARGVAAAALARRLTRH